MYQVFCTLADLNLLAQLADILSVVRLLSEVVTVDNRVSPIDEESVSDAVHALDDVPLWELTSSRWTAVADVLHSLGTAWRDGDTEAFRAATTGRAGPPGPHRSPASFACGSCAPAQPAPPLRNR